MFDDKSELGWGVALGVDENKLDESTDGVGVVDDFPPKGADVIELIDGVEVVVVVVVLGKDVKGEKGGGAVLVGWLGFGGVGAGTRGVWETTLGRVVDGIPGNTDGWDTCDSGFYSGQKKQFRKAKNRAKLGPIPDWTETS